MRLYRMYLSMHLKTLLQHRGSFIMMTLSQAAYALTSFLMVLLLVPPNVEIMGFSRLEILLAGTIIGISYALAECFARGFDAFGSLVASGKFDSVVVRPVYEIQQIFMQTIEFSRIGRFIVSAIVLFMIQRELDDISLLYLLFMIITGCFVYVCIFVIYGSVCFYTTNNLEIFNIVTDGTKEFGKVPFSFYGDVVLKVLTFIIPLALIQYYPMLYLLHKTDSILIMLSPLFAYLFIIPTYLLWRNGRRHYASVGS